MVYQALRDANVPAEMHVYAHGNHGNSLDKQYGPTAEWPQRLLEWMAATVGSPGGKAETLKTEKRK